MMASPEHLPSWWSSWELTLEMPPTARLPSHASHGALHLLPNTGGLFNPGVAGVAGNPGPVALAGNIKSTHTDPKEVSDIFLDLDASGEFLGSVSDDLLGSEDFSMLDDSFGAGIQLDNEDNFLEVFTDLTDFLSTPMEVTPTDELPIGESTTCDLGQPEKKVKSLKRKTEREASPTPAASMVNPDHNDYTTKAKKLRLSCVGPASSVDSLTDDSSSAMMSQDDKYRERREKNNVASRRSRETRKQKFSTMECREFELEEQNEALQAKLEKLEALAKEMKDVLVQRLAQAK